MIYITCDTLCAKKRAKSLWTKYYKQTESFLCIDKIKTCWKDLLNLVLDLSLKEEDEHLFCGKKRKKAKTDKIKFEQFNNEVL